MTKLFVPEIGTVLTLTSPWMFKLYYESRNSDLYEQLGLIDYKNPLNDFLVKPMLDGKVVDEKVDYWQREKCYWLLDLPKGTQLTVDRIYIRKGAKDFSSLSFLIKNDKNMPAAVDVQIPVFVADGTYNTRWQKTKWIKPPFNKAAKKRFWAKLGDVNRIEFE